MNGYIITEHAEEASLAFRDSRVRYAAELNNGWGFVAFDDDHFGGAGIAQGSVLETTRIYDFWWGIKRNIGEEGDALAEMSMHTYLNTDLGFLLREVKELSVVNHDRVLVLVRQGIIVPEALWQADIETFSDKRALVPA